MFHKFFFEMDCFWDLIPVRKMSQGPSYLHPSIIGKPLNVSPDFIGLYFQEDYKTDYRDFDMEKIWA